MQRSGSARIEYHNPINGKPVAEFIGESEKTITFEMDLKQNLGVNVQDIIDKMWDKLKKGTVCSLILGGKYHGDWVITDLSETDKRFDSRMNLVDATLSIKIKDGVYV